jgi:hypothetical protein
MLILDKGKFSHFIFIYLTTNKDLVKLFSNGHIIIYGKEKL